MTSDSGIPSAFRASKARHTRRKRLVMRSMESVRLIDHLKPEIVVPFAGEGDDEYRGKIRRTGFKELPANESPPSTRNELQIDESPVNIMSEMSQSGSGSSGSTNPSSESGGSPVGMLVEGGELVCDDDEPENLVCLSHGSISVIGRRRVMEDAVTVDPGLIAGEFAFFAVYDGHGGSRVANACSHRLHQLLEKEIEGRKSSEKPAGDGDGGLDFWEKVMGTCFAKMDEEVDVSGGDGFGVREGKKALMDSTGSTAVVVVVGTEELVVANCGDSRAVLCRGGVAMPMSHDHKPDRPDERERVEAAGGKIVNWNGCRVQGVLATSRSIGDHYLKPYVISEPEVTVRNRTESDDFLIIASDGLWDVMSNNLACEVAKKCLDGQIRRRYSERNCAMVAAAMLAELAMAKGSKDNVSVIVVELKKSSCTVS